LLEVGEIKSSSTGLPYARKQVAIRCKVLGFLVTALHKLEKPILMGHIFYAGKEGLQEDGIDGNGVSIYYFNFTSVIR